jgi:hypothetical protein
VNLTESETAIALRVSEEIGAAIAQMWARDDAPLILQLFMNRRLTLRIDVAGLTFEEHDEPAVSDSDRP